MPTRLDQKVLDLQALRRELNDLIRRFNVERKKMDDYLKKTLNSSRLARYRKNEAIINYAGFDVSFEEYQRLDKKHKTPGPNGKPQKLKNPELAEYQALRKHFSAYREAIVDKDIVHVKEFHAKMVDDIDECAQEVIKSVAKFKACRTEVVAVVKETRELTKQDVMELECALNLYAIADVLLVTESMPKLLLSERLKVVTEMKEDRLMEGCSVMNGVKVDCIHIMHKHFLSKHELEAGILTMDKIRVYQCQNTDITNPQIITTLEGVLSLIEDAVVNYTLTGNLAAICRKQVSAIVVERMVNQKLTKVLVDSPSVNKDNMGKVYGIAVNRFGYIISSGARVAAIKGRISRIQQDKEAIHLPYARDKEGVSYSESNPRMIGWDMEEEKEADNVLFESEAL